MSERPKRKPRPGFTMADAINKAMDEALGEDPTTMLIGEDVGRLGGVFRLSVGLQDKYGAERVVDTPLAEAGFSGAAVGLALNGMRPIVEIQFDGFIYPALNEIFTQVAKIPQRIDDPAAMPVTFRIPCGGRIRSPELHSESPEAYFAHTPDLHVVAAGDPRNARALLLAAIRSDEPYIYMESKRLYRRERIEPEDEVAELDPTKVRQIAEGEDLVIFTYGPMIDFAKAAAQELAEEGIGAAVVDLVSLAPLDEEGILEAAGRSGRVMVAAESIERCSVAASVIALLATKGFDSLRAAPRMVLAPNRPYPPARQEDDYLPSRDEVVAAARALTAK
jgi:pyruvate/2-oxoglutarate/acetoin dehydrogenase E1 component